MSFLSIKSLLPGAFARIDRKHKIERARVLDQVRSVLGAEDVEYRRGVITVYSHSQTLKQKIFLSKDDVKRRIEKGLQGVTIRDIVFKGPRM